MYNFRYQTMVGASKIIAEGAVSGSLDAFGISKKDFTLCCGERPWTAADRKNMRATLDSMLHGMVDAMGLPRFKVPVEYVAAAISIFVGPVNVQVACGWYDGFEDAQDLAGSGEVEALSADKLFALVLGFYEDPVNNWARERFSKRCSVEIKRAMQQGVAPVEGE